MYSEILHVGVLTSRVARSASATVMTAVPMIGNGR